MSVTKRLSERAIFQGTLKTRNAFLEEDIPINPPLPEDFDSTPNDERPGWQIEVLWNRPFIVTTSFFSNEKYREEWYQHWPSGIRYDVRCLDGGAWDRSTCWGMYPSLDEALDAVETGRCGEVAYCDLTLSFGLHSSQPCTECNKLANSITPYTKN